jgi:hypothetical protein
MTGNVITNIVSTVVGFLIIEIFNNLAVDLMMRVAVPGFLFRVFLSFSVTFGILRDTVFDLEQLLVLS